jgi:hypothetical protein
MTVSHAALKVFPIDPANAFLCARFSLIFASALFLAMGRCADE